MNMFGQTNEVQTGYSQDETATILKSFMARVFMWMTIALAITAFVAYFFAKSTALMGMLYSAEGGMTILGWIVMFAPVGFVLLMSFGFQKLSAPVMIILFIIYSLLMGMSLSFIFMTYTTGSIYLMFLIAAGIFAGMSILGYTTKIDLTRFGSIMLIGLVGVVIASVVNMFLRSSALDFIISIVGVLIFIGLTAYNVQNLKRIGSGINMGDSSATKQAVMGALTLYLSFINIFLFLLRLFGKSK
jgi:uncharacterized protein